MKKTKTIKIDEYFCDDCGKKLEDHFGKELGKCPICHKDICPSCRGVFLVEIYRFRGCSGVTAPKWRFESCLDCAHTLKDEISTSVSALLKRNGIKL